MRVKAGVTTLGNDEYFPRGDCPGGRATIGVRSLGVANRINEFALDAPPRYNKRAERRFELDYVRREKAQKRALLKTWSSSRNGRVMTSWFRASAPHAPDLLSTDMLLACAEAAET